MLCCVKLNVFAIRLSNHHGHLLFIAVVPRKKNLPEARAGAFNALPVPEGCVELRGHPPNPWA